MPIVKTPDSGEWSRLRSTVAGDDLTRKWRRTTHAASGPQCASDASSAGGASLHRGSVAIIVRRRIERVRTPRSGSGFETWNVAVLLDRSDDRTSQVLGDSGCPRNPV